MFIKVAVLEMSPLMLVSVRLALASLTLVLLQRLLGLGKRSGLAAPPLRELWRAYLWVGFINAVVPYTLIAWGEEHIASGTASILNASTPLFTALLASMAAGYAGSAERLTPPRILGLLVGFAGVAVLVVGSGADIEVGAGRGALLGEAAVLVASLAYGVGGLYARRRFAGVPPILPATWQSAFGAMILLPFALVLTPLEKAPSWQAAGSVAALGIFGTALALLLYYQLLARVGATRTVMVTYLLPVMALIYGAVFLHEHIGLPSLLGLALVLSGIAITARAKSPRTAVTPAAAGR
jgi:drug/metabolite transporter (DMT)-like permease